MLQGYITADYKMGGHTDVSEKTCPGVYFYENWVQQHPHWSPWPAGKYNTAYVNIRRPLVNK